MTRAERLRKELELLRLQEEESQVARKGGSFDLSEPANTASQAPTASTAPATSEPTPGPEMSLWDHLNRAAANQIQGLSSNTAHRWAPHIFAAMDEGREMFNATSPASYGDRVERHRRQWIGQLDPAMTAAGSLPAMIAMGNAAPALNAFPGVASSAALYSAGDVDRRGGDLASPMGALEVGGTAAASALLPYLPGALVSAGGGLKNLAGWMKVNSIHPTPGLGKKMADLPGGISGVGKELLERGIGGLTKGGTARQTEQALNTAGGAMDDIVNTYDAGGGAPIDMGAAIAEGRSAAAGLMKQPTTKPAGRDLSNLLDEYQQMFAGRNASAAEALEVKRAVGKAVYGAGEELKKSGVTLKGDYGKGLGRFERALDNQLDSALGPGFENANLTYRRLLGANEAAETQQARSLANLLLLGLGNTAGAGVGTMMAGGAGGLAGLATTALLSKYGSQAGARTAYGIGRGLEIMGAPVSRAVGSIPMSRATASPAWATLRDLLESRPAQMTDALALGAER